MASNSPNWNILIVGAVVVGGLYAWYKIKNSQSPNTAIDYVSGTTGETISDATQPTIRTDLRNAGRTQRVAQRNPVAEDYVSGVTGSNISDASQGTIRTDIRATASMEKAANRQSTRIILAENRQATRITNVQTRQTARTTRQTNVINFAKSVGSVILNRVAATKSVAASPGLPMSSMSNVTTPIYNANTVYTRLPQVNAYG